MISRIYTVEHEDHSTTYKGFDCKYVASEMDLVALVQVADTIEVYVLNDTQLARNELVRFLADEMKDYGEHAKIIGIYRRSK